MTVIYCNDCSDCNKMTVIYRTVINFKLLLDLFDIVFILVNIVRKFYSVDDF